MKKKLQGIPMRNMYDLDKLMASPVETAKPSVQSAHTPGPWHVGIKQAEQIVYDAKGWAVANATVYHGKEDLDEMKANARLIAAAPDLKNAVSACLKIFSEMSLDQMTQLSATEKAAFDLSLFALAKSEGRA